VKKKPFPIDRGKMRKEQQGEKTLLTAASIICHLERKNLYAHTLSRISLHLSVIVNLLFWCCNVLNGGMKERARTYEAEHHVVDNHRMFNCQVSG
jgi:hypothetical protein